MKINIKPIKALPLPAKIILSVVGVAVILNLVSRFNYYNYQKKVKENTTPHKQAVDISKVPTEVKSFLSDENLQKMDEVGMNIYTGNNPPNVEGTYSFKNQVVKYDPDGGIFHVINLNYSFQNQKNDNSLTYAVKGNDERGEYTEAGKGVIISGEGKCFSVYLDNSSTQNECQTKSAEIFSACKEANGLVDMDRGTLWTYVSDKCTKEEQVPAGYFRIFTQKTLAPKK
ncbi:hypothetical protein HYS93_04060 [Candidatus Daviesbacteria bacterium]|nr:hypothetical protein [Candidatus Daviesbacteria bacterium]